MKISPCNIQKVEFSPKTRATLFSMCVIRRSRESSPNDTRCLCGSSISEGASRRWITVDTYEEMSKKGAHLAAGGGEGCFPDGAVMLVETEFTEEGVRVPLDDATGETTEIA